LTIDLLIGAAWRRKTDGVSAISQYALEQGRAAATITSDIDELDQCCACVESLASGRKKMLM